MQVQFNVLLISVSEDLMTSHLNIGLETPLEDTTIKQSYLDLD